MVELDMAGDVGTQALAVTIRVLMDETLTGKQKAGLVIKEIKIGLKKLISCRCVRTAYHYCIQFGCSNNLLWFKLDILIAITKFSRVTYRNVAVKLIIL